LTRFAFILGSRLGSCGKQNEEETAPRCSRIGSGAESGILPSAQLLAGDENADGL
jgi:hypothetical protein